VSDPSKPVECAHHGPCIATFTCRHLAHGVGCGYHAADALDDPWPDAWCDACEVLMTREGGWNDASEEFARIQLLCSRCYEGAREMNRRPTAIEGLGAPATSEQIASFIEHCVSTATELNSKADREFELLQAERWYFDSDLGTLTFSSDGVPRLVADVQLVGSLSDDTNTWLWAWANPDNSSHLIREMHRLPVFGTVRGWDAFACEEAQPCTLEEAWEHAAVATILLEGEAVFRAPMDHLHHFMVLRNLRRPH
jgi:hypothetical protein